MWWGVRFFRRQNAGWPYIHLMKMQLQHNISGNEQRGK